MCVSAARHAWLGLMPRLKESSPVWRAARLKYAPGIRRRALRGGGRLMTTSSAANRSVGSAACPVCEHVNPPDSRFCNACGAPLPLVPCHRCGAMNEPTAPRCHQCDAWWPGKAVARSSPATEASVPAGSGARSAEGRTQPITRPPVGPQRHRLNHAARLLSLPLWGLVVIVGTVVLAASIAGGYYAYRGRQAVDASRFGAASGAARGSGGPAATGALVNPSESAGSGAPGASSPASAVTPPGATDAPPTAPAPDGSAAAMRPGTTAPLEARSATTPPVARSSGEAIGSPRRAAAEAKAPAEPAAERPRAAGVAAGVIEQPPRVGPCTEAVAALGLCTPPESAQRRP